MTIHVAVTGAGAGIGAATVAALVAAGARVSAGDITPGAVGGRGRGRPRAG